MIGMAQQLGLEATHPLAKSLFMASVLGGIPMRQAFHSHHHTREVVCMAGILALLHNKQNPFKDPKTRLAEIMIAACIHDFAHDGLGNKRGSGHTPMRLEKQALAKAEPYLKAAGINNHAWTRISAMVLATDISKGDHADQSPAEWLRLAFRKNAFHKSSDGKNCPPELKIFFTDHELAIQGALLEDADLGTSAGMPYDFARRMTALIAEETKILSPTPETLIGFIDHICGGAYTTDAARTLFGENIKDLRQKAREENEDTIYYWN
jgi:hypothetical protein